MTLFLTAVVAGIGVGAVYALIAQSYNVVFASTGIFNLAQGDLMMLGVLVSYFGLRVWNLPQAVCLLLVLGAVVLASLFEELVAVAPFLRPKARGSGGWFISTLAFSVMLAMVTRTIYGSEPVTTIPSLVDTSAIHVGTLTVAPKFAIAFALLVLVTLALSLFYNRTTLGVVMRGVSEDQEVAEIRGIDTRRISRAAFVVAGLVSGFAAFAVAPIVSTDFALGFVYTLKGFIALAIGGFGSLKGCAIGGIVLGVVEQLFNLYLGTNFEVLAGLVAVLVLLSVRPRGLFGMKEARSV